MEESFDKTHPALCEFLDRSADLAHVEGDSAAARDFHVRSLHIKEAAYGDKHESTIDSLYSLAQISMELDEAETALRYITRVHEVALDTFGPDHPLAADAKEKMDVIGEMLRG